MEEKSLLLEFFGDSPFFRIIDFLLEHRLQDYSKTEIARGAKIGWATLYKYWDKIEKRKIVKPTRKFGNTVLYQLNESEPLVKEIKKIEMLLISRTADEEKEKVMMKVTLRKK